MRTPEARYDPFALVDGYVLDVPPSDREAALLRRQRDDGDRVLIARDGRGYVWERSPAKLHRYLVEALVYKGWITPPGRYSVSRPTAP